MQNDNIYHTVTLKEAKANPAYWQVVANIYQEQIVRIMQRNWRKKHDKPFPRYQETLKTGEPRLQFLKEPKDRMLAQALAEQIKQGEWATLNFSHDDTERALYQALRLNYISTYDLSTALWLYHLKQECEGEIRQFSFTEPYRFRKIPYQKNEHDQLFQQAITQLPAHQRYYFSVNLSADKEAALLYTGLTYPVKKRLHNNAPFLKLLQHYYQKNISCAQTRCKLRSLIYALPQQEEERYEKTMATLATYIQIKQPFIVDKNMLFLLIILGTREPLPLLDISPDHQEEDSQSPNFCLIVYHDAAMLELHRALFNTNMTYPFFTAGNFSTRFIRHLDEKLGKPHRPIQLPHTDLMNAEAPHGHAVQAGINLAHDHFHWYVNSENMFKDFYRHLRQVIEASTNFDMTKGIWIFSDMDTRIGKSIRTRTQHADYYKAKFLASLFEEDNFSDEDLLLIIDLIIHTQKWNEMLSTADVHELFSQAFDNALVFYVPFYQMERLIQEDMPPANSANSAQMNLFKPAPLKTPCYYLLAYHFANHPQALALLKEANMAGLQHFFAWRQNKGICFYEQDIIVREMSADQFIKNLSNLLTDYKANPETFLHPQTSRNMRRIQ